jgi:type IV pilus assembly protein PilE
MRKKGISKMSSSCRRRSLGFTLLEVLITVVIVGILAAIALPSYEYFVTRSRIVEATTALGDMRSQMEKFFMDNRTYDSAGKCAIDAAMSTYNANTANKFALTCAGDAVSYVITATGGGPMSSFAYTINQQNVKTTTGTKWGKTSGNCWVTRDDGSCL